MPWVLFAVMSILATVCIIAALGASYAMGQLDAIRASRRIVQGQANIAASALSLATLFMGIGVWIVVAG